MEGPGPERSGLTGDWSVFNSRGPDSRSNPGKVRIFPFFFSRRTGRKAAGPEPTELGVPPLSAFSGLRADRARSRGAGRDRSGGPQPPCQGGGYRSMVL